MGSGTAHGFACRRQDRRDAFAGFGFASFASFASFVAFVSAFSVRLASWTEAVLFAESTNSQHCTTFHNKYNTMHYPSLSTIHKDIVAPLALCTCTLLPSVGYLQALAELKHLPWPAKSSLDNTPNAEASGSKAKKAKKAKKA